MAEFIDLMTKVAALGQARRNEGRADQQLSLQQQAEARLREALSESTRQFDVTTDYRNRALNEETTLGTQRNINDAYRNLLLGMEGVAEGNFELGPNGSPVPITPEERRSRQQSQFREYISSPDFEALTPEQRATAQLYGSGFGISGLPSQGNQSIETRTFNELTAEGGMTALEALEKIQATKARHARQGLTPKQEYDIYSDQQTGSLISLLGIGDSESGGVSMGQAQRYVDAGYNPDKHPVEYEQLQQVAKLLGISTTAASNKIAELVGSSSLRGQKMNILYMLRGLAGGNQPTLPTAPAGTTAPGYVVPPSRPIE